MSHYCDLCKKFYASSSSLYTHKKTYHDATGTLLKSVTKPKQTHTCKFCNKTLSSKSNLNRHTNTCKHRTKSIEKITEILDEYGNGDVLEMLLAKYKGPSVQSFEQSDVQMQPSINNPINSYNTSSMSNSHNQNTQIQTQNVQNNNNSNNNNTQNINIQIVPLGQENLCDVLSANEQLKVLKQKYESLEYLVKHIHFNQQYPQFQNIAISNLKDNVAYKYDENAKDFVAVTKEELLNDLIENRMNDIHDFCNNNEISEKLNEKIEKLAENMENDDYLFNKKQEVKLIVYNGTGNKKRKLMLKK